MLHFLKKNIFDLSCSDYLLDLWDAEEESKNQNKNSILQDDFQMFNDKQWKDQWYMVSILIYHIYIFKITEKK